MTTALDKIRNYVTTFQFKKLFIDELGWDNVRSAPLTVNVDGTTHMLHPVAEKRGLTVLACSAIPPYAVRRRIDREVTKYHREHLIVFAAPDQSAQVWLWVRREPGKPAAGRERHYYRGESGERVAQTLAGLVFTLEEEEQLTLIEGVGRVRAAFDIDRVTKRFYDRFKREHDTFLKFIRGIPDQEFQRWYASVMLNRIMFVYFVQRKGFMDGDANYLATRLARTANTGGNYYCDFLRVLFFQGFAVRENKRTPEVNRLLGSVPYLNGGLFAVHTIEEKYGNVIQIENTAFEQLFAFFDEYNWHLDERPLHNDREINPDVLGYIFEKYINQKQMGAYYTKEDITGYICKNVIIPYLFDAVRREYPAAFDASADAQVILGQRHASDVPTVWRLLAEDPDRYIYPAVRRGVEQTLPSNVAAGIADVSQRSDWNRSADPDFALPTEIWREVVARRARYAEVRAKLIGGTVTRIDDLITLNLDIRQFARDVIDTCDDPALLRQLWRAIVAIAVLDPTGGSGAFLFAALTILEDLYDACLERMEWFLDEQRGDTRLNDFRETLAEVARHPNRRYYIFKSIIVNNLYAVDIMEEAVEICKLRLFLKLVAQIDQANQIEPLPDIDFNIRAGNTLVGFVTREDVQAALERTASGQGRLVFAEEQSALARIEEKAKEIDRAFANFRRLQTQIDVPSEVLSTAKVQLQGQLRLLEDELNRLLAREYGVKVEREADYQGWLESHKPFHWFVEFYGVLRRGGFDAIVGNPPYVEYVKVKTIYSVQGYSTANGGNLYVYMLERAVDLLADTAYLGMITPMSLVSTDRTSALRELLFRKMDHIHISNYSGDAHPSTLFSGVKMRLSIVLGQKLRGPRIVGNRAGLFSSNFIKWYAIGRPHLFEALVSYLKVPEFSMRASLIPKIGHHTELSILQKLFAQSNQLGHFVQTESPNLVYAHRIVAHFVKAFDFVPYFWNEMDGQKRSEDYKVFGFASPIEVEVVTAALSSTIFYYFYLLYSDAYHCGRDLILSFPFDLGSLLPSTVEQLSRLSHDLMQDLGLNSERRRIQYRTGWIEYDEFYPRLSKPIIDEIDHILATHYGFTAEELDYIINYDIKYRLGTDAADDDDE